VVVIIIVIIIYVLFATQIQWMNIYIKIKIFYYRSCSQPSLNICVPRIIIFCLNFSQSFLTRRPSWKGKLKINCTPGREKEDQITAENNIKKCIVFNLRYCNVLYLWVYTGFELVIGFIGLLNSVTTKKFDRLSHLSIPDITVTSAHLSLPYLLKQLLAW
jgi:hypothetical protein